MVPYTKESGTNKRNDTEKESAYLPMGTYMKDIGLMGFQTNLDDSFTPT